ncbi:MAG TPA: FkbM family methyltransferase [Candidatus Acidoferrales bacterium]|nr:FkbM family methyltransferase [Candidatus Acidoferrales bacterium]
MHASRRRFEELLWIVGLSRVTAPLWERLRGGRAVQQSRLMRQFYAPLLPQGSLVFDIGANVGTMTQVFTSLSAKVIAVEPNPDCVRHIELTTPRESVEVLQAAVGEKNGLAVLKVSDRKDKMSSLSDEWRDAIAKENHDYAGMWKRELTVPLLTLDTLIERYGMPHYIKIDVEGYEEQVLKGLSALPPLLSFEFNRLFLEPILQILVSPIFRDSTFNYTLIDPVRFELRDWVSANELTAPLRNLSGSSGLGDIFARNHPPV